MLRKIHHIGIVVRNLEEGFALEFVHEQVAETLEEQVTAR